MASIPGPLSIGPGIVDYLRNVHQQGAQRSSSRDPIAHAIDSAVEGEEAQEIACLISEEDHEISRKSSRKTNSGSYKREYTPIGEPREKKAESPARVPLFINNTDENQYEMQQSSPLLSFSGTHDFSRWNTRQFSHGPAPHPGLSSGNGENSAQLAGLAQIAQTDALQANQLLWQMFAERQRAMVKLFQVIQDLSLDTLDGIAECGMKRSKNLDTLAALWASVLGGYELDDQK